MRLEIFGFGFSPSVGATERDYLTYRNISPDEDSPSLATVRGDFILGMTEAHVEEWSALSEPARRGILEQTSPDQMIVIANAQTAFLWQNYSPLICTMLPILAPLVIFGRKFFSREDSLPRSSCEVRQQLIAGLLKGAPCEVVYSEETAVNEWPRSLPSSELVPGPPSDSFAELRSILSSVDVDQLLPGARSAPDAVAFKAGLFLLHDDLPHSHELSQSIEGAGIHRAADYWHAILHRREPDYGNAKYWFRALGEHPIFKPLGEFARQEIAQRELQMSDAEQARLFQGSAGWHPLTFVDLCEQASGKNQADLKEFAESVQRREMWLLLKSTWQDALGESAA
ncbi:MAG: hypothetical protein U0903_08165 [Planctomycetales bacterium]